MSCVKTLRQLLLLPLLVVGLAACDLKDDLLPSSSDERGSVVPGSIGHMPGQVAADFTLEDIYNNDFILSDHLAGGSNEADVVVLYFTMWCPVCLADTDQIYTNVIPQFSNRGTVVYALIDYLYGSVSATYAVAQANGYVGSSYSILVDVDQAVLNQFKGDMGVTVVIDSDGTILMNEVYNLTNLTNLLNQQLP